MAEESLVGRAQLLEALESGARAGTGVALTGPAGIGKTHLMSALADRAARTRRVVRVVATEPMRSIPFGPLLSLLPVGAEDRAAVVRSLRQRLAERDGQRRPLLAIDDAHLLDEGSLACVLDVTLAGEAVVALTVRTEEDVPTSLSRLWTGGPLRRVEVGALTPEAVDGLIRTVLDGPVDDHLSASVAAASGGNPLLARELVYDAVDSGTIRCDEGEWRLRGALCPGIRLRDFARDRMAALDPVIREVAEIVALVEPVDPSLASPDPEALEAAVRLRVVRLDPAGERWEARSDHPLIGQALREGMSPLRKRKRLKMVAERAIESEWPARGDALRAVDWCRNAALEVPARLAGAAAEEAVDALDLDLALDLVERAVLGGESWTLQYLRGNIHRLRGDLGAAELAFARAAELASGDQEIARTAERRAWAHAHLGADPSTTAQVLEAAASEVGSDDVRHSLIASASNFRGLLGRFDQVRQANLTILETVPEDSAMASSARRNLAYARATLGEAEGVKDLVDRELTLDHTPDVLDLLRGIRCTNLFHAGDLHSADRQGAADMERCRARGTLHSSLGVRWGLVLHLRGRNVVHEELAAIDDELQYADPFGLRARHHGVMAAALADCGRLEEANALLDEIGDDLEDSRSIALVGRARAAVIARSGDRARACEVARAVGDESVRLTQFADGALALHEATRHGRADLALEVMRGSAMVTSPFAETLFADAMASAARDGKALALVADRYRSMGAALLAADAMARACGVLDDRSGRTARRIEARARLLAETIDPFIVDVPEVPDRLSDRELQVARSAAVGLPSRTIAEQAFLSVRTVDNHLRRVYRKLGVGGRSDLAEALGPLPVERPPSWLRNE